MSLLLAFLQELTSFHSLKIPMSFMVFYLYSFKLSSIPPFSLDVHNAYACKHMIQPLSLYNQLKTGLDAILSLC